MELASWDMGTHCCPQPWLEALSSRCSTQVDNPKNSTPPALLLLPTPGASPQEPTTEGAPSPDHPAGEPICLRKSRWGGTSWEAAPGILRLPWQALWFLGCRSTAAVCQRGSGLPWECRWAWEHGLGNADAGDGAVTAMPTHPLPPVGYF